MRKLDRDARARAECMRLRRRITRLETEIRDLKAERAAGLSVTVDTTPIITRPVTTIASGPARPTWTPNDIQDEPLASGGAVIDFPSDDANKVSAE